MMKILTYLRDARRSQTKTMPIFRKSRIQATRLKLSEQHTHSVDNYTFGALDIEDFDPVYREKEFKKIQQSVRKQMGLTTKFTP